MPRPPKRQPPPSCESQLSRVGFWLFPLRWEIRTSLRGVPYIHVVSRGHEWSVAWFGTTGKFRVFFPFRGENQVRRDFTEARLAARWIKDGDIRLPAAGRPPTLHPSWSAKERS